MKIGFENNIFNGVTATLKVPKVFTTDIPIPHIGTAVIHFADDTLLFFPTSILASQLKYPGNIC